jgi:hypothetical protein
MTHFNNPKFFDFVKHEEVVDKLIAKENFLPLMSNSKWRKVFEALELTCPDIQVIWRFIGAQNSGNRDWLPPTVSLEDRYINNQFWFGPMYYKEIEWLEIPHILIPHGMEKIPGAHKQQDAYLAKDCIEKLGHFHIETTGLGFRLYGWRTCAQS